MISNATQLIRATRGRGIVISSEAKRAAGCRGPWDVVNLAAVWGLGQEKGREAVGQEARSVVVQAQMKRRSYRGVIDVIYGGEKPAIPTLPADVVKDKVKPQGQQQGTTNGQKRKAGLMDERNKGQQTEEAKPISKREQKRQAKKARLETPNKKEDLPRELPGAASTPDPVSAPAQVSATMTIN